MTRNLMRKLALAALALTAGSVAALAADLSGKWTAQAQGRMGTQTITFNLHAEGSSLTGKISTPRGESEISNGKIDGDNISFDQALNVNGNDITVHYTGKIEGDTIHFSRSAGNRPAMSFDAKRGDSAPMAAPQS